MGNTNCSIGGNFINFGNADVGGTNNTQIYYGPGAKIPGLPSTVTPDRQSSGSQSSGDATIPHDRTKLALFLMELPDAQFDMLLIALDPPDGNIPPSPALRSSQVTKLFEWLESPVLKWTHPLVTDGMTLLRTTLEEILPPSP